MTITKPATEQALLGEVSALVAVWKPRMRLWSWSIDVVVLPQSEFSAPSVWAETWTNSQHRHARIGFNVDKWLSKPEGQFPMVSLETAVVHELAHIVTDRYQAELRMVRERISDQEWENIRFEDDALTTEWARILMGMVT
jgi:hypothetical protein